MNRADLLLKIRDILADVVDDDTLKISESTKAQEVHDWDSVNHVKLIIALETDLNIRFKADEINDMRDVGGLIDAVQRHVV